MTFRLLQIGFWPGSSQSAESFGKILFKFVTSELKTLAEALVRDCYTRFEAKTTDLHKQVAIKPIPQETVLFTIPRKAIINVQTSELPKKLPSVFDGSLDESEQESEPLDSWGALILVMIYENLQGEASYWKPYLDILPDTFDTPIFWTESELKELEGTCLTPQKIGKQESNDMLRLRIIPVVLNNPTIFYPNKAPRLNESELLRLAHRMGSTIMAYAFDLEDENEQSENEEDGWVEDREGHLLLGMVPMADVLNANADFNVCSGTLTSQKVFPNVDLASRLT